MQLSYSTPKISAIYESKSERQIYSTENDLNKGAKKSSPLFSFDRLPSANNINLTIVCYNSGFWFRRSDPSRDLCLYRVLGI